MSSRVRRFLHVLLAAAVLQALPSPAMAQQGILPVAVRYSIPTILGPTEICVGVEETYTMRVEKQVGYDTGSGSTQWVTWGGVAGLITIDTTGAARYVVFSGLDGVVTHKVTASTPGTLTITASASNLPDGGTAPPVSITVQAEACDFDIQQMSIWFHLREGFKPWVGGLVDPLEFRVRLNGGAQSDQGPLRTFAIAKFDCPISFDVLDVEAGVVVQMTRANVLHYDIGYTQGTATVTIACPTPVNPVGGTSKPAPFSLDGLAGDVPVGTVCVLVCWTINGPIVRKHFPHVLHQTSDANGITYVIVEPK